MNHSVLAAAALLVSAVGATSALPLASDPAAGFGLTAGPSVADGPTCTLADGRYVGFDGRHVRRFSSSGVLEATLADLGAPGIPGAVALSGDESFVVVGVRSGGGQVYRVGVNGGGATLLGNVPANVDAIMLGASDVVVAGAAEFSGNGNVLWRLDTTSGARSPLAALPGVPGPVTRTSSGWLLSGLGNGAPGNGLLVGLSPAQLASPPTPVHREVGGLLVMEVESAPLAGAWVEETGIAGYTGESYYRWNGGNLFGSPGNGILTYQIEIQTEGNYRFRIRNRHDHAQSDKENDVWVRMDFGTWYKCFSNGGSGNVGKWNWLAWFEHHDIQSGPSYYYLTPGVHTLQISARSFNYKIDRIHLALENQVANPFEETQPVSRFSSYEWGDVTQIADGLDQPTGLAADPAGGTVYIAETDGASARVRELGGLNSGPLLEEPAGTVVTDLAFLPSGGNGVFFPFQPAGGGGLVLHRDGGSGDERLLLAPRRPRMTLSGPGTGGVGPVTLELFPLPQGHVAYLMMSLYTGPSPVEVPYVVGGLPLVHTGLDPATAYLIPEGFLPGPDDRVSLTFDNPFGAPNVVSLQGLVFGSSGELLGSTTSAGL
jgi:hypothetical protein